MLSFLPVRVGMFVLKQPQETCLPEPPCHVCVGCVVKGNGVLPVCVLSHSLRELFFSAVHTRLPTSSSSPQNSHAPWHMPMQVSGKRNQTQTKRGERGGSLSWFTRPRPGSAWTQRFCPACKENNNVQEMFSWARSACPFTFSKKVCRQRVQNF